MLKNKQILLYFIYICFSKMILDSQFQMVIVHEEKGIGNFHIGILETILLAVTFILEIPSGFLSDVFGYRNILMISKGFMLIYSIVMFVSKDYLQVAFAFACYGISEALSSGTEETFIYKLVDNEETVLMKTNSLISNVGTIFGMLATLLGGFIAEIKWEYIYIIGILLQSTSILFLLLMKDDKIQRNNINVKSHFKDFKNILIGAKELYARKEYVLLSLSTCLCDSIYSVILIFYPLILRKYNYGYLRISGLSVIAVLLGFVFVFLLGWFKDIKNISFKTTLLSRVLLGLVTSIAAFANNPTFAFITVLVVNSLVNVYFPSALTLINASISAEIRATANSATNALQSLCMLAIIPLYTYLIETENFGIYVFALPAVFYIVSSCLLLPIVRQKDRKIMN